MNARRAIGAVAAGIVVVGGLVAWSIAGPLDPPAGPVAPTLKTLAEVEPRVLVNDANTPGDANSTFVISKPGSYYLGANIITSGGKNGVQIAADNVTLDLNGFTIDGTTNTATFPSGVIMSTSLRRGFVLRNGNVNGFKGYGITGNVRDAHFENLALKNNQSGSLEIFQSVACIVRHVRVTAASGEVGIEAGMDALVEDCVVDGANTGIIATGSSVVARCALTNQTSTGISIGGGIVEDCTIDTTSSTASFSNGGISLGGRGFVRRCSIKGVVSAGVFLGGDSTVENCVISFCARGIASSQFASGRCRVESNDINNSGVMAIDLPAGRHIVIGNRLRDNAANINANATCAVGDIVTIAGSPLPAAAANPTANLVW